MLEPAPAHMDEAATHGGAAERVRLNLGAGERKLPGFHNLDAKTGDALYPLPYAGESVDEVRASHVLEHFPRAEVPLILKEWVRVLKPGGALKIAVPNFQTIAEWYLAGKQAPIEGYVMGGQTDSLDFHKALFDREQLYADLHDAGLRAIRTWTSEIDDCAALPVSLNLMGNKLGGTKLNVQAVMSVPRLGFTDNFDCAWKALKHHGIGINRMTGAYWGQCLTVGIEKALAEGAEIVITTDYDTIYTERHVMTLIELMAACPEIDALAPIQMARWGQQPLWKLPPDAEGKPQKLIAMDVLRQDVMPADHAHFGLTAIRASALRRMAKPWFHAVPDPEGSWGEGRVDADIAFWHGWKAAGNRLFIANRVAVGHAELLIMWPDKNLETALQYPGDFTRKGVPPECWE